MFLTAAAEYTALDYVTTFFGLTAIILTLWAGCAFIKNRERAKKAKQAAAQTVAPVSQEPAPGAAGELKLHNVEPKIAAMLMAIVADKMGKPLNELRFISIKEVTEDEV